MITSKSLKLWVVLCFDVGFSFSDWKKEAEIGEDGIICEGATGKSHLGPSEPWGLSDLRPGAWAFRLQEKVPS